MNRCLVGISGGIDSLFAALVLKSLNFDVLAVHIHLHSRKKLDERVVDFLNDNDIEFYYADYRDEFRHRVVDYFISEYSKGYTPNPCVVCNKEVKLPVLFKEAKRLNIGYIATGHYANIDKNGFLTKHESKKDQSYFLACISRDILTHAIFPLQNFTKEQIRQNIHMDIKESSDLCFVKRNYRDLLKRYLGERRGEIVKNNKVVGYHSGFYNYTIGQRKGIKVGNSPHYVTAIDAKCNTVYADEESKLYTDEFCLDNLNLFVDKRFLNGTILKCAVRYNTALKSCKICVENKKVELMEKERAVTPGQIAVFYDKDDRVVACGKVGYGFH